MATSDVPVELAFVDPEEEAGRCRVVLWAPPGFGKSTAAATAPGPIVAVTCDRPGAWRFARKTQPGKDIREVRYENLETLRQVVRYLAAHPEVETVVIDPWAQILDKVKDEIPRRSDGDYDYQTVNKKVVSFVTELRRYDVHVVICAHEKVNDGRRGDGKLYPALGGAGLINRVMAEMDVVASLQPEYDDAGEITRVIAALRPVENLVNKEGTGAQLPARMEVDLTAWFEMIAVALKPDESDLPWGDDPEPDADLDGGEPEQPGGQLDMEDARAEAAA